MKDMKIMKGKDEVVLTGPLHALHALHGE